MKKTLLFFVGVLVSISSYSQGVLNVFKDWSTTAGTQAFYQRSVTKVDGSGNVYIAGATLDSTGTYDILLVKNNSSGVQQWIVQYNGTGNGHDVAVGLYVDGSGNVYITGVVTTSTNVDMVTIKYNSSGTQQWLSTYNGTGSLYDCGSSVVTDGSGNVYVCGSSYNASGNLDYVTIKYNSSGTQQWATLYAHSSGLDDAPVKIGFRTVLGTPTVTVSGAVQTGTTSYSFGVIKYNGNTGVQTAATITSGGSSGIDQVFDMAVDTSGNTYIAGGLPVTSQGYNTCIIKLNSSLAIQWQSTYNGASNLDDMATGIMVNDATGNVYFTGYTTSSTEGKNFLTVKYNSSGTQQWAQTYNDTLDGEDVANGIIIDASDNVYVTGYDSTAINGTDYYTIKYNSSGTEIWNIREDGDAHKSDRATNIALVGTNIAVTGSSLKADNTYEYKTLKYIEHNVITPTDYNATDTVSNSFLYYENKGQLISDTTLIPAIKYYTENSYPNLYFKNNSFSMVFGRVDTIQSSVDTLQRIDVTFNQVNSNAKTYSLEEKPEYLNYFLTHCPQGVTEINGNQRLVTTNLYTNIDLIFYSNQSGFKYYFIVKPGGNPANIQMEYTGATSFNLDGTTNVLSINSIFDGLSFKRPTVYQLDTSNVVVPITGWTADWQTNGASNKYKFNLSTYNTAQPLVIMVETDALSCSALYSTANCRWSTFFGGAYHDQINATKLTPNGWYFYNAGSSSSTDFPITPGMYYSVIGQDATLSKFEKTGLRLWATYYGGNGFDDGLGVTVNSAEKATMVGYTNSTGISMIHPANSYWQSGGNGGGNDGFIVRFISSGTAIEYSNYFGGSGDEALNDIVLVGSDKYVVGKGTNNTPHITRSGAYNSLTTPTGDKGIIAHFNSSDSLIWSTYMGNDIRDVDYNSNSLVFGGEIKTTDLPYTYSLGMYIDSTLSGTSDAFFAKTSTTNDTLSWATYYGGTTDDVCNSVKYDNVGAFYGVGMTGKGADGISTNDMPLFNPGGGAYYDSVYNGNGDIAIWKFSSTNSRLWTTLYGKTSGSGLTASYEDFGNDIAIDNLNQPYFCGTTRSPLELLPYLWGSPNPWFSYPFYSPYNVKTKAVVMSFAPELYLHWSTAFGSDNNNETGASINYDAVANYLYLTGTSNSISTAYNFQAYKPSPTYSGWYKCENAGAGSASNDGYIVQFILSNNGVGIEENENVIENQLISFPNPFSNEITLNFNMGNSKDYVIEIFNTLGQIVYSEKEKSGATSISKTITLPEIDKGMYFVRIKLQNHNLVGKIIKQ